MSLLRSIMLVVSAAWICGACAHQQDTFAVTEAVGPAPLLAAAAPPQGFLRVYTPTVEYDDDQALYDRHRNFSILAPGGETLQYVVNADDRWDQTPARVSLPAGSYKVESRTLHGRVATVPVVVEEGRTTNVYLDGSFAGPAQPNASGGLPSVSTGPGDFVTLPDGEIIGWSVTASSQP
jgi:hypothetical protein